MNLEQAIQRAIAEPTLADALAVACIWQAERAMTIEQAKRTDYRCIIKIVLVEYEKATKGEDGKA